MKKSSLAMLLAALPILILPCCRPVLGQGGKAANPAPTQNFLTLAQATNFSSAFRTVSERGHICLLAENAPLFPTLTDTQAQKLVGAFTLDEVLSRMAAAYDYKVEGWYGRNTAKARSGDVASVYLFRKKYTDERDLPDVTFDESLLLFREMEALIKPYMSSPPITSNTNGTLDVADALSQEQLKQMAIGDGIPMRDLRPEQRKAVWRLARYAYVDSNTESLVEAAPYLSKAAAQGVLVKETVPKDNFFKQSFSDFPTYAVVLAEEKTGIYSYGYLHFVPCCTVGVFHAELTKGINAANNEASPAAPDTEPNVLGKMVADYAQRSPSLRIGLEKSLNDRRVSQFNSRMASPVDQMYAIASLLDLQVQHRTNEAYQLTRPRVRDPRDVSGLFQTIRGTLLPGSLRRYFNLKASEAPAPAFPNNEFTAEGFPKPNPQQVQMQEGMQRSTRAMQAGNVIKEYMRPGLRRAFQAPNTPSPLPFASLDAKTRGLFGLYWVLDRIMPFLLQVPLDTPPYISHFDEASLQGGWHGEEPKRTFSAMFIYHPAPGQTSAAGFRVGSKRFKD